MAVVKAARGVEVGREDEETAVEEEEEEEDSRARTWQRWKSYERRSEEIVGMRSVCFRNEEGKN